MKNKEIIFKIFNIKKNKKIIDKKKYLEDFNWDSMAMIALISLIDEKYNKNIQANKLRSLKTLNDLDKLITQTLKKK
jgi:acyl carrier protein